MDLPHSGRELIIITTIYIAGLINSDYFYETIATVCSNYVSSISRLHYKTMIISTHVINGKSSLVCFLTWVLMQNIKTDAKSSVSRFIMFLVFHKGTGGCYTKYERTIASHCSSYGCFSRASRHCYEIILLFLFLKFTLEI